MPAPVRHRIERRKRLESGNVHAESELSVANLNGALAIERSEDDVVSAYKRMAINGGLRPCVGQQRKGKKPETIHDWDGSSRARPTPSTQLAIPG
jgi:hypothetical protein